ncbi:hypothetical protein HK104_003831, partial [Borealophlyctis nickersoniae]
MRISSLLFPLGALVLDRVGFILAESVKTPQQYLNEAKVHLSAGRHSAAIESFSNAIEKDERNYNTYFRRGVLLLTLGKTDTALTDFSKVLELKPDHDQALLQRGKLLISEGSLEEGIQDLKKYTKSHPNDAEAAQLLTEAKELGTLLKSLPTLTKSQKWTEVIDVLSRVVQTSPRNVDFRLQRADAYLRNGDQEMAIGDLTRVTRMQPDRMGPRLQLAQIHMALGEPETALTHVKECLRSDPEHKECKKEFRGIKKLVKAIQKVEVAVQKKKWREAVNLLTAEDGVMAEVEKLGAKELKKKMYEFACQAHAELKKSDKAMHWCSKTLDIDENNLNALIYRAEAKMAAEDYEAAMRDFQKAHELDKQNQRIISGFQKAQSLQRQSSQKNYYKVLGVPRTATQREIKKAYRKLAQEWHPDTYRGELSEEDVVKKMSEINEAYQVLSDE